MPSMSNFKLSHGDAFVIKYHLVASAPNSSIVLKKGAPYQLTVKASFSIYAADRICPPPAGSERLKSPVWPERIGTVTPPNNNSNAFMAWPFFRRPSWPHTCIAWKRRKNAIIACWENN